MRIAVVNTHHARVGGAESYLDTVIAALGAKGHRVALLSELEAPAALPAIRLPVGAPVWPAARLGWRRALAELRAWHPDVSYVNGMDNVAAAAEIIESAPAVLFAHGYYGACISGAKMFASPRARPCTRRFGPPCLALFYPRRCGGLNPLRMWRDYRTQRGRLALLGRYAAVLTASEYMRAEFLRYGLPPERVHALRLPLAPDTSGPQSAKCAPRAVVGGEQTLRLLFVGRMTRLKGGMIMLDAVAAAAALLGKPLEAIFVGEGPARAHWERRSRAIQASTASLRIEFRGWLDSAGRDALMREADLLVVPSTWPEPFGLVGPEAGLRGIPAVAFAVGGIPEWLHDGVNGRLAPGGPPSAAGLARAIVDCLRDPAELARLGAGARAMAERMRLDAHVEDLLAILARAAGTATAAAVS